MIPTIAPEVKTLTVFQRTPIWVLLLREKLTPRYGFGCKRPSFSNTYYPIFLRDNVELVTEGIDRIMPTGIRATDGIEYEIDVLVLATGFKVYDVPYDLHGTNWRSTGFALTTTNSRLRTWP